MQLFYTSIYINCVFTMYINICILVCVYVYVMYVYIYVNVIRKHKKEQQPADKILN
jgi:hypothetical protein